MVSRREHSSVAVIWLSPGRCAQSIPPDTDTGTHHSAHEHTSRGLSRQEGGAGATAHGISRLAARAFLREGGGRGTPKCEGVLSVRGGPTSSIPVENAGSFQCLQTHVSIPTKT